MMGAAKVFVFAWLVSLVCCFGHYLLPYFTIDEGWIHLNNGAFGSLPIKVKEERDSILARWNGNWDKFVEYELEPMQDKAIKTISQLVNAPEKDIVLVEDVTSAMSSVLRSFVWKETDMIMHLDCCYSAVMNLITFLGHQYKVPNLEVVMEYPATKEWIIKRVTFLLDIIPQVSFLVIDHFTSHPAMLMPIKEIIAAAHSHNVPVLVDGAHALGQIKIDLQDLGADFYCSNAHKWFYANKGAAFLYVNPDSQWKIFPERISVNYGDCEWKKMFSWQGTRDWSPQLAIPASFEFRKLIGGEEAIMNYTHNLIIEGSRLVASMWKTSLLNDGNLIGSMANVRIPTDDDDLAKSIPRKLMDGYNCTVPTFKLQLNKKETGWFCRISAQVFNEISDFKHLANSVLDIINKKD